MMYKRIMANSNNSSGGGGAGSTASGGMITILQAAFIICKIIKANVIGDWPWWKVMLPLICSSGLMIFICCCGIGAFCCVEGIKQNEDGKNNQITIEPIPQFPPVATSTKIISGDNNV